MPINSCRFDAQDSGQITLHTVGGTPVAGQNYTLSCNGKSVVYQAITGDTNTTIAAALVLLLQAASTILEIQEAQFTSALGVITSTSTTAGVPYTFTTSATGTGTFVTAITQPAVGHQHWGDPANWTLGRIPAGVCAPPVQAAPVAVAGGTLAAGAKYWVITSVNANGETTVSNQETLTIAGSNNTADLSWAYVPGALSYNVYRSTVTGVFTTPALVANVPASPTPTYSDTGTAVGAGAPPVSSTAVGDDIFLTQSATSLLYDLPSDYLVPNSLHVDCTFTGQGGLPDQNTAGYFEYRPKYLMMAPLAVYFGENGGVTGGGGCPLFRLDKGSLTPVAFECYQTGNPATQGLPALWVKGAHAADTFVLQQGYVGIAYDAGDTAQFATLKVGYQSSPPSDVQLTIGAGCVCGAVEQLGGVVNCSGNVASLSMTSGSAGTFYLNGSATMGPLTIDGGTYYPKTTGTHAEVLVNNGGSFLHTLDMRAFTIESLTVSDGCTFKDPAGTIILPNPVIPNGNPFQSMNLDFGTNPTVSFAP